MLVQIAPGHLVDPARIFHAELCGGSEDPELILWFTGVAFTAENDGGSGPWSVTLTGQDAASAWRALGGQDDAATPTPPVTVEPVAYELDGLLGHTFQCGPVEVFRPVAPSPVEVFGPWDSAAPTPEAIIEAARALRTVLAHPSYADPRLAIAAD